MRGSLFQGESVGVVGVVGVEAVEEVDEAERVERVERVVGIVARGPTGGVDVPAAMLERELAGEICLLNLVGRVTKTKDVFLRRMESAIVLVPSATMVRGWRWGE